VQNLTSCDTQLLTGLNAESNSVPSVLFFTCRAEMTEGVDSTPLLT